MDALNATMKNAELSFDAQKATVIRKLVELDKSPKGSVDAPIVDLVRWVNDMEDYVTTSSCSGRISVFACSQDPYGADGMLGRATEGRTGAASAAGEEVVEAAEPGDTSQKGPGTWLLVEHRQVNVEEVVSVMRGVQSQLQPGQLVQFKVEPFILHVLCRHAAAARRLARVAVGCGFRETGILLGKKTIVAIRTIANGLDVPVVADGTPTMPLPSEQEGAASLPAWRALVAAANSRFRENANRTARLFAAIREQVPCASDPTQPAAVLPPLAVVVPAAAARPVTDLLKTLGLFDTERRSGPVGSECLAGAQQREAQAGEQPEAGRLPRLLHAGAGGAPTGKLLGLPITAAAAAALAGGPIPEEGSVRSFVSALPAALVPVDKAAKRRAKLAATQGQQEPAAQEPAPEPVPAFLAAVPLRPSARAIRGGAADCAPTAPTAPTAAADRQGASATHGKRSIRSLAPSRRLRAVAAAFLAGSGALAHVRRTELLEQEASGKVEVLGDALILSPSQLCSAVWGGAALAHTTRVGVAQHPPASDAAAAAAAAAAGGAAPSAASAGIWPALQAAFGVARVLRRGEIKPDGPRTPDLQVLLGDDSFVNVREAGIRYHFDARKCMFCTGNLTEKVRMGQLTRAGEFVVDLFCGIGYFTLHCLRAGAGIVHACDWNPAAIEAIRGHMALNGLEEERLVTHQGDNRVLLDSCPELAGAADRILLGLIPKSDMSWGVAVQLLRDAGGRMHIHGLAPADALEQWGREVEASIRELAREHERPWGRVQCVHVENVKSYAPRVVHCVADIELGE